jgi:hypothetical protein
VGGLAVLNQRAPAVLFWVEDAIAAIAEDDWQPLEDYPDGGEAQIAQALEERGRGASRFRSCAQAGVRPGDDDACA